MDIITRQEAKAAGLTRYFTGLECKRGHVTERKVSDRCCCACKLELSQTPEYKAKQAEYNKLNAEQIATQRAEYRKSNSGEIAAKKATSYAANADTIATKRAVYYKANADTITTKRAVYYAANRVEITEKQAGYRKANPHIMNAIRAKRRAAKLQATPSWADTAAIKEVYRQCAEKTKATGIPHAVDHVYPLISKKVCGLHVAANLQVLTASENSRKHNRMPAPEHIPSDLE